MRLRTLAAGLVSWLPFAGLRTLVYRAFPGYRIASGARIGWRAIVAVDTLEMAAGSSIGSRTVARGPVRVVLGERACVGPRCRIECGEWVAEYNDPDNPYRREFVMGADALATEEHYFDAVGGLEIGEGAWIAGVGTQIWTHGLGVAERDVCIGRYTYVGSACRFAPGSAVGELSVVGLGSVVTSDLSGSPESLVAGVPARVGESRYRASGWSALSKAREAGRGAYAPEGGAAASPADA